MTIWSASDRRRTPPRGERPPSLPGASHFCIYVKWQFILWVMFSVTERIRFFFLHWVSFVRSSLTVGWLVVWMTRLPLRWPWLLFTRVVVCVLCNVPSGDRVYFRLENFLSSIFIIEGPSFMGLVSFVGLFFLKAPLLIFWSIRYEMQEFEFTLPLFIRLCTELGQICWRVVWIFMRKILWHLLF